MAIASIYIDTVGSIHLYEQQGTSSPTLPIPDAPAAEALMLAPSSSQDHLPVPQDVIRKHKSFKSKGKGKAKKPKLSIAASIPTEQEQSPEEAFS